MSKEQKSEVKVEVKVLTFTELGEALSYNATTIRCWARKPVIGQPYDPSSINYEFINAQLNRFNLDAKAILGGVLGVDIMIDKSFSHSGSSIKKLNVDELQVGTTYLVISHTNRFHYVFKGTAEINDEKVYIFQDERYGEFKKTQDTYRALSATELKGERWTLRELSK